MDTITLTAVIDEARHFTIDLPATVPIGPVELTITPLPLTSITPHELTRDVIRQKLAVAGVLSTAHYAPDDAVPLSDDERDRLGQLLIGPQSLDMLIDEDRGSV